MKMMFQINVQDIVSVFGAIYQLGLPSDERHHNPYPALLCGVAKKLNFKFISIENCLASLFANASDSLMKTDLGAFNATTSSWPETRWDRVMALRDPAERDAALRDLCVMYRGVILALCRDWNAQEAEELTQAFFEWLIEERVLEKANPKRGRLRDFLKKVLRNFLRKQYRSAQAQKRGGAVFHVELEEDLMADSELEDTVFDRQWALAVMKRVIDTLKAEVKEAGIKAEVLHEMIPFVLLQRDEEFNQNEVAAKLGRPAGSVRSEVFKIKNRFRELLEREVANTASGSDVQAEIQYLMRLLLKKA